MRVDAEFLIAGKKNVVEHSCIHLNGGQEKGALKRPV